MPSAGVSGPHIRACGRIVHIQTTMSNMLVSLGKELVQTQIQQGKESVVKMESRLRWYGYKWRNTKDYSEEPVPRRQAWESHPHSTWKELHLLTAGLQLPELWANESFNCNDSLACQGSFSWGVWSQVGVANEGETKSCVKQDGGVMPQGMGIFCWLFSQFKQRATKMDENNVW